MAYIFGGSSGLNPRTPEEAARLRAVADALAVQRAFPHTIGEGLSAIGEAIASRRYRMRADRTESEGRANWNKNYGDLLKSYFGGSGAAADPVPTAPGGVVPPAPDLSQAHPEFLTGGGMPPPPSSTNVANALPPTADPVHTGGLSVTAGPAPQQPPEQPGIQLAGGAGFDPRIAEALSDPWLPDGQKAVLQAILEQQIKANAPVEYGFTDVKGHLIRTDPRHGTAQSVYDSPPALPGEPGGDEYGLTPVYGTDAQGNPVILQTSKSGKVNQPQLPPGFKLTPGVKTIDLGTGIGVLNRAGDVVGVIPKDVAGEAAAKAEGTATGTATVNLPGVEEASTRALNTIDNLLNDPALPNLTGPVQSRLPTFSGDTARAEAKLKLIQGQTFLQAYNDLRGAGQISEREGQAAQEAYNRLKSTGVNDADFVTALREYRIEIQKLVNVARQKAGQPPLPIEQLPQQLPAGVSEEDIQATMQAHGWTREQVLERLNARP